jgi:spermidine/putrescine-binding protein
MTEDRSAGRDPGAEARTVSEGDAAKPDYLSYPRRTFIGKSFGVALAIGIGGSGTLLSACGGSSGSGGSITVLGFESYIDPKLVALWNKSYPDIAFNGVPAADDSELYTKLKAGGADAYDVVFCDFGYCPLFRKSGLVEDLDLSSFAAADDLYPQFRDDVKAFPTYLLAPDKAIGFPCQWGPTAMTFNTQVDYIPSAPYSWTQMWNAAIPDNHVGFEGLPPEGFIATAALAKGFTANEVYSLNQSQLNGVVDYFKEITPFRTFDADPLTRDAIRTENVWVALCPTPAFATLINKAAGQDVSKTVIPKEGSIGYVDGPMLVKGTSNRDNAIKYINWFAGNQDVREYIFTAYSNSPTSKKAVEHFLQQGGDNAQLVKILKSNQPQVAAHMVLGRPPDDPNAYAAAWDAIQA